MSAANNFKIALFTSAAIMASAAPAFAQEASDDLVITAQRREQNVQDVPITLQVVTGATIDALAADDIGDLSAFVPGLSVSNASPTQARYSIRGVTTSDFGVGTDPAVGVYVDGVYAARSGAGLLAFSDVARIEVLKGPQGTLFGRNSAAGAVSITTNQPGDTFEARIGVRAGEYDKRRVEAMLNVPLGDTMAFRINALANRRDGWLTDAVTGEDYDREDNWAVRGAFRWDLSPATTATIAYTHDNVDQDARPAIGIIDPTSDFPVPNDPSTFISPYTDTIFNDAVDNHETRQLDEVTLTLTHDFGGLDFTSLTSGRYFETENREDEDGTNRIDLYLDTNNREKNHSFYQEFRLSGQTDRFDWIAGVSYYDEHAQQRSDTFTFTDSINTLAINNFGFAAFDVADAALSANSVAGSTFGFGWAEDMINDGEYSAAAVYGDVIWHVTDRMNLTLGARYTHDEKTFEWFNGSRSAPGFDAFLARPDVSGAIPGFLLGLFAGDIIFDLTEFTTAGITCDGGIIVQEGVPCSLSDSWNDVSPRVVVDYRLTDDVMAFASFAQGYKAGGFNSVQPGSRFDNEDVDNYELGIKSDFDNGVRLNASVFRYLYEGKQSISLVPVGTVSQYVTTTSDDEAWGSDVQLDWSPNSAFNIFANVQYIDATFKDNVTPGGLDLSGQPTGEPLWSLAGGVSYHFDLSNAGTIDVSLQHSYRGEGRCNDDSIDQGSCSANAAFDPSEAQNRTDFRTYWRSLGEHLELGLFVNNLFDDQYVTGINNITANDLGTPFVNVTEPRMWGIDFTYTH